MPSARKAGTTGHNHKKSATKRGRKKSAPRGNAHGRGNHESEVSDLQDAFFAELGDMLHAEKQIVKALPKMIRAVRSPELREAFENHLEETEGQVERIEQVFERLERPAKAEVCEGMRGILEEGEEVLGRTESGPTRDALIISAAQKVEHYEIASYGSLCSWAEELGRRDVVDLLEETLREEKMADKKLTRIAEQRLNRRASQGYSAGRSRESRGGDGAGERYRYQR
jgi:ferritin-like metal-binding protein YciE